MTKSKKTKRKFYNKWLYKVSLSVEGAYKFRIQDLEELEKELDLYPEESTLTFSKKKLSESELQVLKDLVSYLKSLDSTLWSKRIERSILDIYTNDQAIFEELSLKFENSVLQRFEPFENSLDKLNNDGVIVSKKLPHDRYQFRVYLKPHKLANELEEKQKYISWIKNQHPKITCTPAVESWFIKTNWNWDRRYVLVEDEQTLLMLKLRNSEVMGRIYNYVICDK